MGTQETVAFQSSLPESGRTNPDSRKRSFPTDSTVPIRAGGETRERPFARNEWIGEAAIRYALVLFSPGRQQCSGCRHWQCRGHET